MTNRGTRNRIGKDFNVNDYISLLPDEIILIILSQLEDSAEAARTSILSTRWRNLWKFIASLNIDGSKCFKSATSPIFVKRVYQILGQHRAQTIDKLAITYPSSAVHQKLNFGPNNLIDIAIRKKVRTLKLHFWRFSHVEVPPPIPPFFGSSAFSSLVTLHLLYISLSSEVIGCILSDCPNLEELSVYSGRGFVESLGIGGSGSSLRLKRLELLLNNIKFLEISAPKLVSLYFMRLEFFQATQICFKDVPLLTNLRYRGKGTDFCVLLPQLESLTLVSPSAPSCQIPDFLVLKNLKQMDFRFCNANHGGLHWFLRIFEASPCLCRLKLKFDYEDIPVSSALKRYSKQDECVEVIEIYDFNGWDNEVELVLCIAQSCSSLKKIVIRFHDILKWEEGCVKLKSAICKLKSLLPQQDLQFQLEDMRHFYANMCWYAIPFLG